MPAAIHSNIESQGTSLEQIGWKQTRFDGSLFPNGPNPYRGPPGEEIDSAWDRFTTNREFMITTSIETVEKTHGVPCSLDV